MTAVPLEKTDRAPKSVTILGSTGSIGCNTVKLITHSPERFAVEALTAHNNVEKLAEQALALQPKLVVIGDKNHYPALKKRLEDTSITIEAGEEALAAAAARPSDLVMAAIVGAAGLRPALEAVKRGATVALANKECLVCAGDLFMKEVRQHGATLLPVDSEHNAIFQVFDFEQPERVEKVILTASGGPFREASRREIAEATPEQALKHPNWDMGAKITIDSATMMNKALELIEAWHLFPVEARQLEVVVHPESVVHGMVQYTDGSVLAQMGNPDMCTPIAHTLAWPERMESPNARLDLTALGSLTFEAPDPKRFPAIRLAKEVLKSKAGAATVFNAANEVAVAAFLERKLDFPRITRVVEQTLESLEYKNPSTLEAVMQLDQDARERAKEYIQ